MSSANSTAVFEILNPETPLGFIPRDLANQFEVSRYLYAVTLGGYIWDIAVNLGSDYQLLFKHRIRYPTVIYYLSRIFSLSYIVTAFIFQVGRVPNCNALLIGIGISNTLAQTMTALLFYLRVRAIFHRNKVVKAIFFVLWLGVSGCTITVPLGIKGAHIGPTQQCINTVVAQYTEATAIMGLINDSAIFIAISYQILTYNLVEDTFKARVNAFFGGGTIPRLSRSLLQGGQHYYLIAVWGNVVLLILVRIPNVPDVYRGMCTIPVIATINLMACIVFRKIKFGLITHDGTTIKTLTQFSGNDIDRTGNSLPSHYHNRFNAKGTGSFTLGSGHPEVIQVEVMKTSDSDGLPLDYIKAESTNSG